MQHYIIYSDGACSGNPGPGGWGWVLLADKAPVEKYSGEPNTTNNRMELTAAIEALKYMANSFKDGTLATGSIEVRTDSQYVKNGITAWIKSWKKNNWKTASKTPVKNIDLWQSLDTLSALLNVKWVWVEGHSGELWNERCDELARLGVASL